MNPLLQLYAKNRAVNARTFAVNAKAADEAEILLYDVIVADELEAEWFGGVAPKTFVEAVRKIDAKTIHLRINSPGGSVFAATAMKQALNEHPARIVVHIDGVAASAATDVMLAGDEIIMGRGAMMMIHNAWAFAMGNASELRKTADLLEKVDGNLADAYAGRSTAERDQIVAWMAEETWFTADEAVAAGLADSVADEEPKSRARWDLSAYARAPKLPETTPKPDTHVVDAAALKRRIDVKLLPA